MARLFLALALAATLLGCGGGDDGGGTPIDGAPTIDARPGAIDAPGAVTVDSESIGAAGGTLTVDGAVLTIPAGALASPVTLTLTRTSAAAPSFVSNGSPVYELEPDGQTFAQPVTLAITLPTAPATGTVMFWGRPGVANPTNAADFEMLTFTQISGNTVTAMNNHFTPQLTGTCQAPNCPPPRNCNPKSCGGGGQALR